MQMNMMFFGTPWYRSNYQNVNLIRIFSKHSKVTQFIFFFDFKFQFLPPPNRIIFQNVTIIIRHLNSPNKGKSLHIVYIPLTMSLEKQIWTDIYLKTCNVYLIKTPPMSPSPATTPSVQVTYIISQYWTTSTSNQKSVVFRLTLRAHKGYYTISLKAMSKNLALWNNLSFGKD